MQTTSREQRDYHHGPNKVNRETRINCPSNIASTTSRPILAVFANQAIKTFEGLSCQSTFRQGCKGRTFLVDREFKDLQWKVPNFVSNRLMHINGCINKGVMGHIPGDINRWTVVKGGIEGSHQHTRGEGSAFSHIDFCKIQIVQRIYVQMENKVAMGYLVQMGGTHNKDLLGLSKQKWIVSSRKRSQFWQNT